MGAKKNRLMGGGKSSSNLANLRGCGFGAGVTGCGAGVVIKSQARKNPARDGVGWILRLTITNRGYGAHQVLPHEPDEQQDCHPCGKC
jgi:lipoprotein